MKTVYIERNNLFKNISMLLCNKITEVDPTFYENNPDLFYSDCEACNGGEKDGVKCEECGGNGQFDCEVYQYFLCDLSEWDQKRLKDYNVPFGYSELLDLYVIPIYDFGTSWSAFSYSKEVEEDYQLGWDETFERKTVY